MSRRLTALVIGNAAYPGRGKLTNPANDANDIADRLELLGFSVSRAINCTNQQMATELNSFAASLAGHDVGLVFFAGHGVQIAGENYLIALDTDSASETAVKFSSLSLNRVIESLANGGTSTAIVVLDACRNNPFDRPWSRSLAARGLAPVYAPKGSLIAYATSPGQFADDGIGRNGAYTAALLQHIGTPDCSIENMFKRVRNTLSAATKGGQISWEHTSLSEEFFFNLSVGARIDDYSATALSDSLLVLDVAKKSHALIRELKSYTWPRQNPAVDGFTAAAAAKFLPDPLFLIGRNIYQAACGGSRGASAYIANFMVRTQGLDPRKRKALLDGMLFEIFFDKLGDLRRRAKDWEFNEVFDLQRYDELAESFAFIAECLLPYAGQFYVLPGKDNSVVVDVTTAKQEHSDVIEAVHFGGANILSLEDQEYETTDGVPEHFNRLTRKDFEEQLTKEMHVPLRLLTVKYSSGPKGPSGVRFPAGWTTRKRGG